MNTVDSGTTMSNQDSTPNHYTITVRNSHTKAMDLVLEPEGWGWSMEPGEIFELVFESPMDFWSMELMDIRDDAITYWGVYPCAVLFVMKDGERDELMRVKSS